MDRVHTMWNWVVCSMLTAIVVVRAECPENALQRAQLCTANLGIGPPIGGPNRFVQHGEIEKAKTACKEGLFKKTVSCLRELTDNCTGNTERDHIIKMMIDPDKSEKSVNYFCRNINTYVSKATCIEEAHEEQANCTRNVQQNFKTKTMATVNMDVIMTSVCRFYYAAVSCSSSILKRRCGQTASDIVVNILRGFQPPKCLEVSFDEGTYTVADDDKSASVPRDSSLILLLCTLLCCYATSRTL